ncbi:MAG: tail fiber domain-containing protein [Betaproteobacteria bacterium]|nr:tail fiber domain-containing protein [Betaproteobacteria bacterium]
METLTDADGDFVVYAPTHVRMYAGVVGSGGCVLSSGAGWSCSSDRHLKSGIASIDPRAVLDRVLGMPIARWSFTSMPGITHMGPMAQDFRAAFGLGIDDKSINTVDAAGVALAAIRGLHQLLGERDARLREQAREVNRLRKIAGALEARAAEVDALKRKLAAIEAKLGLK